MTRPRSSSASDCGGGAVGPLEDVVHRGAHLEPARPVRWTSVTRSPLAALNSHCSGARSAAAARGSFEPGDGCGSLATSSDCTTIRAGSPTASTSHWIAATARCVERDQPHRPHAHLLAGG